MGGPRHSWKQFAKRQRSQMPGITSDRIRASATSMAFSRAISAAIFTVQGRTQRLLKVPTEDNIERSSVNKVFTWTKNPDLDSGSKTELWISSGELGRADTLDLPWSSELPLNLIGNRLLPLLTGSNCKNAAASGQEGPLLQTSDGKEMEEGTIRYLVQPRGPRSGPGPWQGGRRKFRRQRPRLSHKGPMPF
ncbi:hypothetical protein E5288_WYG010817 [Bos mutus]|uniref:Apelin n=1 Tax=Bos mutus TaxID=72004 RepID=A0A6B0S9B3_9CETA|nr:hypothetical protein [Bos mutus]